MHPVFSLAIAIVGLLGLFLGFVTTYIARTNPIAYQALSSGYPMPIPLNAFLILSGFVLMFIGVGLTIGYRNHK